MQRASFEDSGSRYPPSDELAEFDHLKKDEVEVKKDEAKKDEAEKDEPMGIEAVVKEIKGIKRQLAETNEFSYGCFEKLSLIELRQSNVLGEGTDAIRAVDQWARGESALLPARAVEVISQAMLANPASMTEGTYTSLFYSKDVRRAETHIIEWWLAACKGETEFFGRGSEYEQGWVAQYIPEFRAALASKGVAVKHMPEELEIMLQLILPMDRANEPYTHEKVKDWIGPAFWLVKSNIEVAELMKKLPEAIKKILTSMPDPSNPNEDPRVKYMQAAAYWRDYCSRYHKAKATVEADATKKAEAKLSKEDREKKDKQVHDENVAWAIATEMAMKQAFPFMKATVEAGEAIEALAAEEKAAEEAKKSELEKGEK